MRAWLLTLALLSTACNAQQPAQWVDLEKQDGASLYKEKCGMCHQGNGMGTTILGRRYQGDQALLENRKDLQAAFIETVLRSGFGVMYPISRGEVSDEQLKKIQQYLVKE